MYNINNFTAVCAKYVHFTLHLLCCLLVHPDKFLILCKWLLRYYYWTYYSDMRHGDRPHNYVSNYIFGFAISSGLTKILPIEKCIIFFETPCIYLAESYYLSLFIDISHSEGFIQQFIVWVLSVPWLLVSYLSSVNSYLPGCHLMRWAFLLWAIVGLSEGNPWGIFCLTFLIGISLY